MTTMTTKMTYSRRLSTLLSVTLALAASVAAATPAHAQDGDGRWAPWVGCWQAVEEDAGSSTTATDMLCVRPSGAGVEVSEIVNGALRSTQQLAADGRAYPVDLDGCRVTRTAEFSSDGYRIFTVDEEACEGQPVRNSTGLIAMVAPDEWVDVQAAQEDGRALGWARRYRPASAQAAADAGFTDLAERAGATRRARMAASARVDVDDVIEALRAVDPEGVRTWIATMSDPFELDRRQLIRLADAHVPASVIDVMVAVSYPDRFALSRDGGIEPIEPRGGPSDPGYGRPRRGYFGPTYYGDPYYGYGSPYGGYGYYGPGVVVVEPKNDASPNAKVVKGKGYTRGSGSGGGNGSGTSVKTPTGKTTTPATDSSSGSSDSSDKGSSSEGRKARPR